MWRPRRSRDGSTAHATTETPVEPDVPPRPALAGRRLPGGPATGGRARAQDLRPLRSKRRSGLRRAAVSLSFATCSSRARRSRPARATCSWRPLRASTPRHWRLLRRMPSARARGRATGTPRTRPTAAEKQARRLRSKWPPMHPPPRHRRLQRSRLPRSCAGDRVAESAEPSTTAAIAAAAGDVMSNVQASQSESSSHSASLGNAVRNRAERAAPVRHDPAPAVIEAQSADRTHKHEVHPDRRAARLAATIWLHRALPDPHALEAAHEAIRPEPSLRVSQAQVHWSLVLGVLRVAASVGPPATKRGLNRLAKNLSRLGARKDEWSAALALEGRTACHRATHLPATTVRSA